MTDLVVAPAKGRKRSKAEQLAEIEGIMRDRALGMPQSQMMIKYDLSEAALNRRIEQAVKISIPNNVEVLRAQQNDLIDLALTQLALSLEGVNLMGQDAVARMSVPMIMVAIKTRLEILKTMDGYLGRRAKLNGLDAPTKVEGTLRIVTPVDEAIENLVRESEAMADEAAN
jgi:hypothetical protein